MSFFNVTSSNPDIDKGSQLARRQAAGIEDIFFTDTSGDITKKEDKPGQVDLTDEVTRRVDPAQIPIDNTDGLSIRVDGWVYVPKKQEFAQWAEPRIFPAL